MTNNLDILNDKKLQKLLQIIVVAILMVIIIATITATFSILSSHAAKSNGTIVTTNHICPVGEHYDASFHGNPTGLTRAEIQQAAAASAGCYKDGVVFWAIGTLLARVLNFC